MFPLIFPRSPELVEVEDNESGIPVVSSSIPRLRDISKVMPIIQNISTGIFFSKLNHCVI